MSGVCPLVSTKDEWVTCVESECQWWEGPQPNGHPGGCLVVDLADSLARLTVNRDE